LLPSGLDADGSLGAQGGFGFRGAISSELLPANSVEVGRPNNFVPDAPTRLWRQVSLWEPFGRGADV
jgi:hypothetical protein